MLSILIFLPLLGGVIAALWPRGGDDGGWRAGYVSLLFATVTLGISIGLIADFDSKAGLQHVTDFTWISQLGIHYKIGVDGLNLFLIALTALLWVGATAWSLFRQWPRARN
jgi:NADH-quinone oxidoreductase subunit M